MISLPFSPFTRAKIYRRNDGIVTPPFEGEVPKIGLEPVRIEWVGTRFPFCVGVCPFSEEPLPTLAFCKRMLFRDMR